MINPTALTGPLYERRLVISQLEVDFLMVAKGAYIYGPKDPSLKIMCEQRLEELIWVVPCGKA